jgi:SAM-dependent methyltransferase
MRRREVTGMLGRALVVAAAASRGVCAQQPSAASLREPDVIYVPTPPEVVAAMLRVAHVGPGDIVYDLGSGDGRIVIAAVKDFGAARGVGVDIDPTRTEEANALAKAASISDRVQFLTQDLFETDLVDATVVTLYLLPALNLKLRPTLLARLKPGTRIVSHAFDMGDWRPEQSLDVGGRPVFFWTVPPRR